MNDITNKFNEEVANLETDAIKAWAWFLKHFHKLDQEAKDDFHAIFGRKSSIPESVPAASGGEDSIGTSPLELSPTLAAGTSGIEGANNG